MTAAAATMAVAALLGLILADAVQVQVHGQESCPEGFTGPRCRTCAVGYRNFPYCEPCPCHRDGVVNGDNCEPPCICKANVVGSRCERCLAGHYHLAGDNPDGCSPCYCFGLTDSCESSDWSVGNISHINPPSHQANDDDDQDLEEDTNDEDNAISSGAVPVRGPNPRPHRLWYITDIPRTKTVVPDHGRHGRITIPNDEVTPSLSDSYYWEAPKAYLGERLYSYGGSMRFLSNYVIGRGDVSGTFTDEPDIVLEGGPAGLRIGYNWGALPHKARDDDSNTTIVVPMREQGWYVLKAASSTRGGEYRERVSREDFTHILLDLRRLLIRAKFHTDQIEATLYDVNLEIAQNAVDTRPLQAVGTEKCDCPTGYAGLSCERCSPGWRRVNNTLIGGVCELCPCHNHAESCDPYTARCTACLHNTMGMNCDQCRPGYYGYAVHGTPDDCRPCACPLAEPPSNNFSPTCMADTAAKAGYRCTACAAGHIGDHCERCDEANGYYGNPFRIGAGRCQKANCPVGYVPPRCDACLEGFFGNPRLEGGACEPCECDPHGSVHEVCDSRTGQCECRPGFHGRRCNDCPWRHVFTPGGCLDCNDNCTGLLLDDLEAMGRLLAGANISGIRDLPRIRLLFLLGRYSTLKEAMDHYLRLTEHGAGLMGNISYNFDLEHWADRLHARARDMSGRTPIMAKDAYLINVESERLLLYIIGLMDMISGIIRDLDGAAEGRASGLMDLDHLLMEAERILVELHARDFSPRLEESNRELERILALLERVRSILGDRSGAQGIRFRIEHLYELLRELFALITERVQTPVFQAVEYSNEGRRSLIFVVESVAASEEAARQAEADLAAARDLIERARQDLIEAAVQFEMFPVIMAEISNVTFLMEQRRGILARLNPDYAERWVQACRDHSEMMTRKLAELNDLFAPTRGMAVDPLRASRVYADIIASIRAAEEAAIQAKAAAERAFLEAFPIGEEALTKRAAMAKERSIGLLEDTRNLRDREVPELVRDLSRKRQLLDGIADDVANGRRNLDLLIRSLDLLPRDTGDRLKETIGRLDGILKDLDDVHKMVERTEGKIDSVLIPALERIREGSASGLEEFLHIIEQARADIRSSVRIVDETELINERIIRHSARLNLDLEELRKRVLMARQLASSIRVSLTTDSNGECARSYRPEIVPSTTNNVILNYAIKDEAREAFLLLVASSTTNDFIAVEMVDRKIRFLWNAGGATQILAHSLTLQTNDPQLSNEEQWYKIEVTRVGQRASLTVKRTPDGNKPDPFEVVGIAPQGYARMDLDSDSYMFVGGLPLDFKAPRELKTRSFAGCLYELMIDGQQVGLWNFRTTRGCTGCKEGATEPKDPSTFQFSGTGSYAILPQIRRYERKSYMITMQFKTLDENAIIFFSASKTTSDYISLSLRAGRILYQFHLNGRVLRLESARKHNTGKWVRVSAERERNSGILSVGDELLEGSLGRGAQPSLELNDAELYIGGVPPNFSVSPWSEISFNSFLGCIKDLQVDTTPLGLLSSSSYGVETGCRAKAINVVSFPGNGYLELKSYPLREEADLSFSFMSLAKDALLLMSTFEGQLRPIRDTNYYSISVVDGLLEARFNGGGGESMIITDHHVDDGKYHTVTVSKRNRRISLILNDEEVGVTRLSRGSRDIEAPKEGGLYLGGLPATVPLKGMAGTREPLHGIIRDPVINGKSIRLVEPVSFENVGVGRLVNELGPVQVRKSVAPAFRARA